jgi:hypothetical protein
MARLQVEFLQRTQTYAAVSIRCYVSLPKDREELRVLGKQMLRSGTSVAAQVREANRARSISEFVAKLGGGEPFKRLLKLCCGSSCWKSNAMFVISRSAISNESPLN